MELLTALADGCCDLVYVDPPFDSTGSLDRRRAGSGSTREGHGGGWERYLAALRDRLNEMCRVLSPRGSLYVHLDWRAVHYVKVMLDELLGPRHFLNEIIWSYRSGSRPGRWFGRKHDTILLYAKSSTATPDRHTFHRLRGGQYRTRGLKTAPDGRPYKSTRKGPVYFHPDGPAYGDVWDIPFLSTVSKERTRYPSQKPEALLDRIIRASSNKGDLVADFYCGSGTALVVAKRLGRRFLGCDINPEAVAIARRRLAQVRTGG